MMFTNRSKQRNKVCHVQITVDSLSLSFLVPIKVPSSLSVRLLHSQATLAIKEGGTGKGGYMYVIYM